MPVELRTLTDGGQTATDIARELAGFLGEARTSLDIALYDLKLGPDTETVVIGAIEAAGKRGVAVRLAYNSSHPGPIAVPPPPRTIPEAIEALPVETRAIPGVPDLMHHKYVVRDGSAVWSGSTNWTDDSWSRQENVIVRVPGAPALAHAFTLDFDELWKTGRVDRSGRVEPRPVKLEDGVVVRAWFTPGYGESLSHRVAKFLGRARRRIRIASPVLSSGPILATLVEVVKEQRCDVAGVIDETQVADVFHQWATNGVSEWKIPLLQAILGGAPFSGKPSTRWTPESLHDFMHAKVVVADDVVFAGSFNFSRSGERNAENVLEIHDPSVAERLARFVDEVRGRYPPTTPPPDRGSSATGLTPTRSS